MLLIGRYIVMFCGAVLEQWLWSGDSAAVPRPLMLRQWKAQS